MLESIHKKKRKKSHLQSNQKYKLYRKNSNMKYGIFYSKNSNGFFRKT